MGEWITNTAFAPLYEDKSRYLVLKGGAGCLAKGTKVIMYDGSLKNAEDIAVGDLLMGIDSKPREVLELFTGYDNLFTVKQNKGDSYTVNSTHVLSLKLNAHKQIRAHCKTIRKRKLYETLNISVTDYINESKRFKKSFSGYRVGVEFQHKQVKLDPYFLGLWLGDGTTSTTALTSNDKEIIDYVINYANELGGQCSIGNKKGTNAKTLILSNGRSKQSTIKKIFNEYNLLYNKHIPDDYLYNSRQIRLQVLAGIIDTDGYMGGNCFEITVKQERLAKQIKYLANSLGFRCSLKKTIKTIKSIDFRGEYYRMNISGNTQDIPVILERKKIKSYNKKVNPFITGINVEYAGYGQYFGFALDKDNLFLLEDFTVTHNSGKSFYAVQKIARRLLTETDHRFIFVRATFRTIRTSQFKLFRDFVNSAGLQHYFDFRETDLHIACPMTNGEVICVGVDDREKLKSLAEPTGIWYEEPTELDELDFTQMSLRLRGTKQHYKQEILTFNPIDKEHWIRAHFFPEEYDDELYERRIIKYVRNIKLKNNKVFPITYTLHHSEYTDNEFMTDEDGARLHDLERTDKRFYDVYCRGRWGTLGYLVFDPLPRTLKQHPDINQYDEVIYGLDFGYFHATALVRIGIKGNDVFMRERLFVRQMNNQQIIEMCLKDPSIIDYPGAPIYGDAEAPDKIDEWRNAGFNIVPTVKGTGSLLASLEYMKSKNLYSHVENVNMNKEFRTYHWKLDANEKPMEEPQKINDDAISAVRGALYTHSKSVQVKISVIDINGD